MPWSFKATFDDVRPAGGSRQLATEGFYQVKIRDTEARETKAGNARALFRLIVMEGPEKGAPTTFGLNLPTAPDDWVRSYWMSLLISLGADEDKLRLKEMTIDGSKLVGKTGYIHFTPAPEGGYPAFRWLGQADYEFQMKLAETPPTAVEEEVVASSPEAPATTGNNGVSNGAASNDGDPLSFLEI
jgi:hypothetical protein